MDIQETAKKLMEGAEDLANSPATKVKFVNSAGTGKHTSSEKLNGSTQGMPMYYLLFVYGKRLHCIF